MRKALDTASMMKDIFTSTAINGINEQLVNLMTGKKTDFKGMASGIFSSVAKSGLTMAEGKLLGGLGSKGAMGHQRRIAALYTISAVQRSEEDRHRLSQRGQGQSRSVDRHLTILPVL